MFHETHQKRNPVTAIFMVLGIILIVAFFSVGMVGVASYKQSIEISPLGPEGGALVESIDDNGFATVNWDYWLSVNPDIVAWTNIPGTDLSYPIVQASGADPDYYNSHDVYGNWSIFGCPFLEASNSPSGILGSKNAVIQAHNINGLGSGMFSALAGYSSFDYANTHRFIYLQTPTTKLKLDTFAVEIIPNAGSANKMATSFDNEVQFERYVSDCLSGACVILNSSVRPSQMWTFSTCSYLITPSNERTVVHCSLYEHQTIGVNDD